MQIGSEPLTIYIHSQRSERFIFIIDTGWYIKEVGIFIDIKQRKHSLTYYSNFSKWVIVIVECVAILARLSCSSLLTSFGCYRPPSKTILATTSQLVVLFLLAGWLAIQIKLKFGSVMCERNAWAALRLSLSLTFAKPFSIRFALKLSSEQDGKLWASHYSRELGAEPSRGGEQAPIQKDLDMCQGEFGKR